MVVLRHARLGIHLETEVPAPVEDRGDQIVVLVPPSQQLVPHPIVNIEQIVSIFTGILYHLVWEWPGAKMFLKIQLFL